MEEEAALALSTAANLRAEIYKSLADLDTLYAKCDEVTSTIAEEYSLEKKRLMQNAKIKHRQTEESASSKLTTHSNGVECFPNRIAARSRRRKIPVTIMDVKPPQFL
jgi:hypothetical protein